MDGTLTTKHSEIMKLIKRFQDKSSGKVGESRKRLKDCFEYVRRKEQKLIIRAFLKEDSTKDIAWACSKMEDYWFPELLPFVKKRWETIQTKELAIFIIHNSSKKYVLSQKNLLIRTLRYYQYLVETAPWGEDKIDNPFVSDRRLSRDEFFRVRLLSDRWLSRDEFYRACFLYGIPIDKDDITHSLFLNIFEYLGDDNIPNWGHSFTAPATCKQTPWNKTFNPVSFLNWLP